MARTLDAATAPAVRRVWASRLRAPLETLATPGASFVARPDLTAVVVVRLDQTTVVAGPSCALEALSAMGVERLVDAASLLTALADHSLRALGAASLAYADSATVPPVTMSQVTMGQVTVGRVTVGRVTEGRVTEGRVTEGDDAALADVVSRCTRSEREESGLAEMPVRVVCADEAGRPVAVAGYEIWADEVAHLGVAVVAHRRREGWGQAAAATAARHALDAGLVPQWRCRLDNLPSARTGDRLGFVRLGLQVAVEVGCSRV